MGGLAELKSAEGLQAALGEHGPRLAVAVLVALLAVQAGFLVTNQNTGLNRSTPPAGPSPSITNGSRPAPVQLSDIVAAHLFGVPSSVVADADAPQTSAPLVLAGVLAVPDPKRGLAIIGPNAGGAKLYTVGSAIPGGVNLYAVYSDRVLLDRSGVVESLLLPKKLAPVGAAPVAAAPAQSPGQRLAALAQDSGGLLGGLVRAQAVFTGGKLSGYRIFPGSRASGSTFNQLGLRPGDMITAVNGTTLDDPNRANEILQTLSSVATATLTVLRNGQSQDVNLNLETVANGAENAIMQSNAAAHRANGEGNAVPAPADEQPEHTPSAQ